MAIKATKAEKTYTLAPAGNHIARVCQVIQIGTLEETTPKGELKKRQKVRIAFELPTEVHVFNPDKGEEPFMIGQKYTLSFFGSSNLRKLVEGIVGVMTDEEAEDYDVSALLGKTCMLNVGHKTSAKGNTYAVIQGTAPLPKSIVAPEAVIPPVILSYDAWNESTFDSLPQFVKDEMASSDEYVKMRGGNNITADDTPFGNTVGF